MIVRDSFHKTVKEVQQFFPKLKANKRNGQTESLTGELDICGNDGEYWGTFTILIALPKGFPLSVPKVYELSNKIKRLDDRHISANGECCLDMEHELLFLACKGINLCEFIKTKVYPYFANQIYYDCHGHYAGDEYKHHFDGIVQFYRERLGLKNTDMILRILQSIIDNIIPGRNQRCLCGSQKKLKDCHLKEIEFLKSISQIRLKLDLINFSNVVMNDNR